MARTESFLVGTNPEHSQDAITGLLTQNPESTKSTLGGLDTNGEVAFGQEFTLVARLGIAANSPAAATNYDALFYNKNAPWKFRVLSVEWITLDVTAAEYTAADAGNLVLAVAHGDGEAAETFTAIISLDLDENVPANGLSIRVPAAATHVMDQAQAEIAVGDSLRARVTLDPDATAGATNDGGEFLCVIKCVRAI